MSSRSTVRGWLLVGLGAMLLGCVHSGPPPRELIEARAAYGIATRGPAPRVNPAQLQSAREALAVAEAAYRNHPRKVALERAYVALRRAQAAHAMAEAIVAAERRNEADRQLAALERQYGERTRAALEQAREQIEAERIRAEASRRRLEQEQAQSLSAEQQAEAERERARQAEEQAQKSQERVQAERQRALEAEQRLAEERQARQEAETQAREAFDRLARDTSVVRNDRGVVITLSGSVVFASGQATLLPTAVQRLEDVATALKSGTITGPVTIEGHTDAQGSRELNMVLAQQRADAVRSFLISRGVEANLLVARGIGPDRPVASNRSAEGRANNRRVEIILPSSAPAP